MIDGISFPVGFFKYTFFIFKRFATKPRESYYISKNILRGFWRYYVHKDKKYNFVINRRLSHHTIYPDGTLITHTKYTIFMLDDGHFKLEKYYESENNEREDGKRKVDMSQCPDIYLSLDEQVQEDRFKEFLLVAELASQTKPGSRFIAKIDRKKSTQKKLEYYIRYTKLKKFTIFSFFVSLSVPREFDRKSKSDRLGIEPKMYGVYEFHSKIDKQSKDSKLFEPVLYDRDDKEIRANNSESLFYIGNQWRLYDPKGGEIKIIDLEES